MGIPIENLVPGVVDCSGVPAPAGKAAPFCSDGAAAIEGLHGFTIDPNEGLDFQCPWAIIG